MKLAKGIKVQDLRVGTGQVAEKGKIVLIHYTCFLHRGDKQFSSRDGKGIPSQIRIGQRDAYVGIDQGIVGMREGGIRNVTVSPHLTYNERKRFPDMPENAMLRYEIELLRVSDHWDSSWNDQLAAP